MTTPGRIDGDHMARKAKKAPGRRTQSDMGRKRRYIQTIKKRRRSR
jgi:hypothetical protein